MLGLYRSDDPDVLVGLLADLLRDPLDDPFATETVSVPTRGIERWISQELSLRLGTSVGSDGVAANIDFPSPYRLIADLTRQATGRDRRLDPWNRTRLIGPVLRALDHSIDAEWMVTIRRFVEGSESTLEMPTGRRVEAARKIAGLFTRYDSHRPGMIQRWALGDECGPDGSAVAFRHEWQPRLWREVRSIIGEPSQAELLPELIEVVRAGSHVGLPSRISVYGLTALPQAHQQILTALGETVGVHLFLLHPSPGLWEAVSDVSGPMTSARNIARPDDPTVGLAVHPLLDSWGAESRELQLIVAGAKSETAVTGVDRQDTLIRRLQADIRANRPPGEETAPPDTSIQIHSCHGPTRQVEVMRDAILHALADDPTLEPRDVIIMCPDVETYAPLVEAAFTPQSSDGIGGFTSSFRMPDLRIRITDRAPGGSNPLTELTEQVLYLACSRLELTQIVEFARRPPVQWRFRLSDDDLATLADLAGDMQVSWGLHEPHRDRHGLDGRPERTWQAGLQRLLAGVFMPDTDTDLIAGVLPLSGVEAQEADVAGRLASLVDGLELVVAGLAEPRSGSEWIESILSGIEAVAVPERGSEWQWASLQRAVADLIPAELEETRLTLQEVRAVLAPLGSGRPTRHGHRTGDLTVSTLVPMRSVPHRIIGLLGMDDGVFPRNAGRDGDDLLAAYPLVGDRDALTEDRQLLLDALMAARDSLIITYSGRDEHTNADRPPCVPVAELLDVLHTMTGIAHNPDHLSELVVSHPLQPFDPLNFTVGSLRNGGPWGFDRQLLAGAETLAAGDASGAEHTVPVVDSPDTDDIALADLIGFFQHPVKAFARQLGLTYYKSVEAVDDNIPTELDPLSKWGVGDRYLRARLSGNDRAVALAAEVARDVLPPANLGAVALDEAVEIADRILEVTDELVDLSGGRAPRRGEVVLDDGIRLAGTVTDIYGTHVATVGFSRLKSKHLLTVYINLLFVTALEPSAPWGGVLVGRTPGQRVDPAASEIVYPLGATPAERRETARRRLADLIDIYRRGLREPIPLFAETSAAWARAPERDRAGKANGKWQNDRFDPECADPHHLAVFGEERSLVDLLDEPLRADEGPPAFPEAGSRFEAYARRLWEPLLAAMVEAE
ncbi:MAG: exodeoxyribonuclease V subunit gamma [Acidimicrobiia bacterium]|nr:exodeoxyribonuclease V subunit gamma [Acidimicrobiia bacterium]